MSHVLEAAERSTGLPSLRERQADHGSCTIDLCRTQGVALLHVEDFVLPLFRHNPNVSARDGTWSDGSITREEQGAALRTGPYATRLMTPGRLGLNGEAFHRVFKNVPRHRESQWNGI